MRPILLAAILLAPNWATAHYAPSGWMYPQECCSGTDCHPIADTDVRLNPDGSYTILATGEVFFAPGHVPISTGSSQKRPFRWSQDERFHRCNRRPDDPTSDTFCLFVPQPGS